MKRYAGVVMFAAMMAGCGGGSKHATRGEQCMDVLQVFCSRAGGECALIPSDQVTDCVTAGVDTCCNGSCTASVVSTQAEIDTCVAAINAATCTSLDVVNGGALPASCVGVVRSALTTATSALQSGTSMPQRAGRMFSN